jgi:Mechanosensitive ion channel MscS, C-terminal
LQTSLNDFFVSYEINAYIKDANNQHIIYSALHQSIQDSCNEAGIEIMSPHYTSVRDGNTTTIPENYRPKDYKPNAFYVKQMKDEKENEKSNSSPESTGSTKDESIRTSVITAKT